MVPGSNGLVGRTFGPYRIKSVERPGDLVHQFIADDMSNGPRRQVLLKVLTQRGLETPEVSQAFDDEAEVALELDHPSILPAFARPTIDEKPAIAYAAYSGTRLDRLMHMLFSRQLSVPLPVAGTLAVRLLQALEYAHERDPAVLHRGINPEHVYLPDGGEVKLAHFSCGGADPASTVALMARLPYLAPEHIKNEGVSSASDLYSVAVLTTELLAGKRVFHAESPKHLVQSIVGRQRLPVERLLPFRSTALAEVLEGALALDPKLRPATALEFRRKLERALAQSAVSASDDHVARYLDGCRRIVSGGHEQRLPHTRDLLAQHRVGALPLDVDRVQPGREQVVSRPAMPAPTAEATAEPEAPAGEDPPRRRRRLLWLLLLASATAALALAQ